MLEDVPREIRRCHPSVDIVERSGSLGSANCTPVALEQVDLRRYGGSSEVDQCSCPRREYEGAPQRPISREFARGGGVWFFPERSHSQYAGGVFSRRYDPAELFLGPLRSAFSLQRTAAVPASWRRVAFAPTYITDSP